MLGVPEGRVSSDSEKLKEQFAIARVTLLHLHEPLESLYSSLLLLQAETAGYIDFVPQSVAYHLRPQVPFSVIGYADWQVHTAPSMKRH